MERIGQQLNRVRLNITWEIRSFHSRPIYRRRGEVVWVLSGYIKLFREPPCTATPIATRATTTITNKWAKPKRSPFSLYIDIALIVAILPLKCKLMGMNKLSSHELRISEPTQKEISAVRRRPIYFILDNVLDTYNIGSLFRLADAVAARKVYLCGQTEYPPNHRIHKAAVGTEAWVPWEKKGSTKSVVEELQNSGVQTVAVEQHEWSTDYRLLSDRHIKFPTAIVVGHETDGVSKEVLEVVDTIVELPMYGVNKSFNVWGAAAVVAYKMLELLPK